MPLIIPLILAYIALYSNQYTYWPTGPTVTFTDLQTVRLTDLQSYRLTVYSYSIVYRLLYRLVYSTIQNSIQTTI